MRKISVPRPTSGGFIEVFAGFLWNDQTDMWIAVVDEHNGSLVSGRGRSQREALITAINKLFKPVQGYNPGSYDHNQVWSAYDQAPTMPESPIVSLPV